MLLGRGDHRWLGLASLWHAWERREVSYRVFGGKTGWREYFGRYGLSWEGNIKTSI
jgi:hypothetical protein